MILVILDDVTIPSLLASKKRIDLRKRQTSEELCLIKYDIEDAVRELPIAALVPARPRYRYSKLAMIMSGVLDELPVPSFDQQPLLEGRSLIDLYRTVERLIERFVKVCRSVAFALSEAWRFSYPSVGKLRSPNIIEVNSKLIRIANDMREIATELSLRGAVSEAQGVVDAMYRNLSHTISISE